MRAGGPRTPGPGSGRFGDSQTVLEADLVARVAQGDTAAFESLYDLYAPLVFGVVLKVLRDAAQAEEVAQEVLIEVWRTATRYDSGLGSPRSWLVTMARRRAIDRVRAAQAAGDREVRAAMSAGGAPYDEVSETVELRLEHEQVVRCLDGLTELQRQSIELAFYRGYSHREVSQALQVPLGTIKTRLRDGLIRLRDCLGVAT